MREVLDNLKCDVYNGEKCYCMTSEEMLNAMKELAKKEEQELQKYKENYECILKQRDDLTKNATQQIESLIDEKNKYKSLYENEKDKNDTLVRIVKKIEEKIKKHLNVRDYSYHKYELFGREYFEELLDLLKEIK